MDSREEWERQFRERMGDFDRRAASGAGHSVSVKVRVVGGCFHREHSPEAYRLIDAHLRQCPRDFGYQEHESGPELLVWLALTAAGLGFAKSVVELVTAIVKARAEGIKRGDKPAQPVVVVVRTVGPRGDSVREDEVLRFASDDPVAPEQVAKALKAGAAKVLPPASPAPAAAKPAAPSAPTPAKPSKPSKRGRRTKRK